MKPAAAAAGQRSWCRGGATGSMFHECVENELSSNEFCGSTISQSDMHRQGDVKVSIKKDKTFRETQKSQVKEVLRIPCVM